MADALILRARRRFHTRLVTALRVGEQLAPTPESKREFRYLLDAFESDEAKRAVTDEEESDDD